MVDAPAPIKPLNNRRFPLFPGYSRLGARLTPDRSGNSGVGAALVHPFFLLSVLQDLIRPPTPPSSLALIDAVAVTVLVLGCLSTLLATGLGMARRGYGRIAVTLTLQPLYWLIMSLAAWRALGQLLLAPQRWEKTDHGFARTSRRRGRLVRIARPTNSAADRRRPPPEAA